MRRRGWFIKRQRLLIATVVKTSTIQQLLRLGFPHIGNEVMEMHHDIKAIKVDKAMTISMVREAPLKSSPPVPIPSPTKAR